MAIITVGFGKTHATMRAAILAASDTDTIEIFEEDAFGGRDYASEGRIEINTKGLTLRSDIKGQRNFMSNFVFAGNFNFTIQDFHFVGGDKRFSPKNLINVNVNGTTLIERCVLQSSTEELITVNGTGYICTVNNCILAGGSSGKGFRVLGTGTFTANYVTVLFCKAEAFNRNTPATCIANNCLAYSNGNDWTGIWTGKNNATTDASGAIGTNPVNGITKAKAGFAYHFSPASGTFFPNDFRAVDAEMAAGGIKDAGDPVSGVTEDIDGRTRDTVNPNIGATEGFLGFGAIPDFILPIKATVGIQDEPDSSVKVVFP